MKKISKQDLENMQKGDSGVKVKRKMGTAPKSPELVKEAEKSLSGDVPVDKPAPASDPISNPAPVQDLQPMAAMAASMAARDAQLEMVVSNNTKAIEKLRQDLTGMNKEKKRGPWRHKIIRRKNDTLIDYVDSFPMEIKK